MGWSSGKDRSSTKGIPDLFGNDGGSDWNGGDAAAFDAAEVKPSKRLVGKERRTTDRVLRQGKQPRKGKKA
jgi:hypothetical protein